MCNAEPMVGVAAVPGIPFSVAYGRACLAANAHPYGLIVGNTVCIGGYEHAAEFWRQMVDDTLTHLGIPRERFDADVAEGIREDMAMLDRGRAEREGGDDW